MPVITRTERTVQTRAVDQPFSRGDGYEAPGRAMMQLGDAIAQAGRGLGRLAGDLSGDLEAENRKRDDFAYKMATTEFANDQELKLAQEGAALQDNGSTFMDETTARYDKDAADYIARVPERHRPDAELTATRIRGDIRMGAYKAGERRAVTYYADETSRVVSTYITGDRFDGSRPSVDGALGAADAVIESAPVPEETKRELRARAAKTIYEAWRAKADPTDAKDMADSILEEGTELAPGEISMRLTITGERVVMGERGGEAAAKEKRAGILPGVEIPTLTVKRKAAGIPAGSTAWKALVASLINQESGGNPNAVSPVGAAGIMQVMPDTAREIARELGDADVAAMGDRAITKWLKVRENGMKYGLHYLKKMLKRYNGDVAAALVAYNGGPKRADRWLAAGRSDKVIPAETRGYYKAILGRMRHRGESIPDVIPGEGPVTEVADRPRPAADYFRELLARDYDGIKKADLLAERARSLAAEKELKARRDTILKEGYDLIEKGGLTQDWLGQNEPYMEPGQYRTFVKALAGGPAQTDPDTYVHLMLRADDEPSLVMREATDALAEKRITKSDWNNIYRAAGRGDRLPPLSPFAREAKRQLKAAIKVDRSKPAERRLYMEILDDFEQAVDANPQMDMKQAQQLAESLIGKYKATSTVVARDDLPWSVYFPGSKKEFVGPQDLVEAVGRLKRAALPKDDFERELAKLWRWQKYFKELEMKALGSP